MKVRELIEQLSALDQDSLVVLQSDSEGNGYRAAYGVEGDVPYNGDEDEALGYGDGWDHETLEELQEAYGEALDMVTVIWPV